MQVMYICMCSLGDIVDIQKFNHKSKLNELNKSAPDIILRYIVICSIAHVDSVAAM